jgi:hypothetical protein
MRHPLSTAPDRRLARLLPVAVATLFLWPAGPVRAQASNDSPLAVHGYLTQGFARAWKNPVAGAPTGQSTLDYRAVALQVGYSFSEFDKLVLQLSHRRLGVNMLEGNENEVRLDWAFYERRVLGEGSIRIGKLPLPRGLFNEIRDVGTALPFYRAPFAIYHESAETFDGATAGYRFFARSPWLLQVEVYGGSYEFDYVLHTPEVSFVETIDARSVHGAVAWLELPVPGTRIGASAHRYRHSGEEDPDWYDIWQLSGETMLDRFTGRIEFVKADSRGYGYEGAYAQVGYRLSERITLNAQHEWADVFVTLPGAEMKVDYIRDLAGGLAWLIRPNAVLKFEIHDYEGYSLDRYTGFENPPGRSSYLIASLAVGF